MVHANASSHYVVWQRNGTHEPQITWTSTVPTRALETAQNRLNAIRKRYVAKGYDMRDSADGRAFVVELHGQFHASFAIVEVAANEDAAQDAK